MIRWAKRYHAHANSVLFKGINGRNDKCIIGNTCSDSGGRLTRLRSVRVGMDIMIQRKKQSTLNASLRAVEYIVPCSI